MRKTQLESFLKDLPIYWNKTRNRYPQRVFSFSEGVCKVKVSLDTAVQLKALNICGAWEVQKVDAGKRIQNKG